MPIYEYNCAKCNHSFDHFARNLADQPRKCPECGSRRVKKQFSEFATTKTFQLASGYGKREKPAATTPAATTPAASACSAAKSCNTKCCAAKT